MTPTHRPPNRSEDFLWSRVLIPTGYAVVKRTDGTYAQVEVADYGDPEVETIYLGGYRNVVTKAEADLLTANGYGPYLTEIL